MGRKNLPPSAGGKGKVGTKKHDTGLPSFFKHRKQQQQQQQQQPPPPANQKGKGRQQIPELQQQQHAAIPTSSASDFAEAIRNVNGSNAVIGIVDPADNSGVASGQGSKDASFSTYSHLSQGAFHGGTKDSSVKAYGRHLRSLIEQSDVLIEVLDARDPEGSRSISSENLLLSHPGKKLLLVLTKIDLVPKSTLQAWLVHLRQFHPTLAFKSTSTLSASGRASRKLHTQTAMTAAGGAVTSLEASSSATLLQLLKNYARSQPKGMSLTVGIFGPPNVGKSSLINSLVRSRACSVAPRPGETKACQTVLLDRKVRLIDSPGVAMPGNDLSLDTQTQEILRGTVKVELVEDPMTPVAEILKRADPVKVTKLYGLPEIPLEEELEQPQHVAAAPKQSTAMVTEDASIPKGAPSARVDFNTMRDDSGSDDEMDERDAASEGEDEDDYHREEFQEEDNAEMQDVGRSAHSNSSKKRRGPIGYDASDPLDFLVRLALTKGKMLRGGRPDTEGAARGVINDWNSGKIAWFVKPPLAPTSVEARRQLKAEQQRQDALKKSSDELETDADDQMTPASGPAVAIGEPTNGERKEEAKTQEDPTVVSGFSQAFDIDALFAQADASMFGGKDETSSSATTTAAFSDGRQTSTAQGASKVNLQAADVSRSSLGKRGRAAADEDDDDGSDNDDDDDASSQDSSDEDDVATGASRRMAMPSSATGMAMEDIADAAGSETRGEDELAAFLAQKPSQSTGDSRVAPHIANKQGDRQNANSNNNDASTTGPVKRGQRGNKKKKNRSLEAHDDQVPAYLAKQQHKASLPVNIKKSNIHTDDTLDDIGVGRGTSAKKAGQERKKKRKMARREGREDGGVWRELEEVSLA